MKYQSEFGKSSIVKGTFIRPLDVIPTGVLALDYALGTGGWPSGSIIEIYGMEDIGKSMLALSAVREAQKLGKWCAWIALEPGWDADWAVKNGVNVEDLIIGFPDDGEKAFDMLNKMVRDDDIDVIIFDSIGAVLRESEAKEGGKAAQGGQSGLITWGTKAAWMAAFKKNKFLIFLNQVRDVMNARYAGVLDSPGGHAMKHASEIRVQLRPGPDKYTIRKDGEDIMVGRDIIAEIKRTKRDEGTGKRAVFSFYSMTTDVYPFGIDRASDVLNTSKRLGIIEQAGPWYKYEAFPDGRLQGKLAVAKWLDENPDNLNTIREKVIEAIR